ncbi:MAG TPA: hypothetical protein DCY94_00415 [Firmicutes bacterium]|nr:hypothetical protein [Bacillota bacterium]
MSTINYLGMRKMYEKSGNEVALVRMIKHYLHEVARNRPIENDEVLSGVDLGDDFDATNLSINEIISLILSDAKQKSVLIDMVLADDADYGAFVLYEKGQIGIDELQEKVLKNCFSNSILKLVLNPRRYEGLDFVKLEEEFFSKARENVWNKTDIDIAFGFLKTTPYGEIHDLMTEKIFESGKADGDLNAYIKNILIEFLSKCFEGRNSSYVLGLLDDRPDYYSLLTSGLASPWLFFENNNVYQELRDSILMRICLGKIDKVARTLVSFRLDIIRDEILNAWVENDRSLELDVYGIPLLEERLEDSLDDVYIQAKNKTDEVGPEQPMTMKPVGEQKAQ